MLWMLLSLASVSLMHFFPSSIGVVAFPIIAEIGPKDSMCYGYNIPEDDEAHMLFLAMPKDTKDEVEDWMIWAMGEMTKLGGKHFMKDHPVMPDHIKALTTDQNQNNNKGRTNVFVKVKQSRPQMVVDYQHFQWFEPVVLRDVKRTSMRKGGEDFTIDGYDICLENNSREQVMVALDVVLVFGNNDPHHDDLKRNHQLQEQAILKSIKRKKKRSIIQKEHLTPLEETFQQSISTAQQILSEMRYMEKRESRMRHTADSTNLRIRYFSYLSVAILLGVTWIQVTYLRSYFKKKKLL